MLTVEMRLQKECLYPRKLEGERKSVRSEENQVDSPFQIDYTQQLIHSFIKLLLLTYSFQKLPRFYKHADVYIFSLF